MFVPVWEAVYRLENMVSRFWLCDGLAANCGLFSLHKPGSTTPVNKVLKPHAHDGEKRYLWFLSDAPHLMKTVRNSWANCKRKLWVSMLSFLLSSWYSVLVIFATPHSALGRSSDGTVQKQQVTDRAHRIVTGAKTEVRTRIPNQLFEDASGPSSTSKQIAPNTTFIHHKYMCAIYTHRTCNVAYCWSTLLFIILYVPHRYSVTQCTLLKIGCYGYTSP